MEFATESGQASVGRAASGDMRSRGDTYEDTAYGDGVRAGHWAADDASWRVRVSPASACCGSSGYAGASSEARALCLASSSICATCGWISYSKDDLPDDG